eukprot:8277396-Lingulodinium_polyedra.AAC.1
MVTAAVYANPSFRATRGTAWVAKGFTWAFGRCTFRNTHAILDPPRCVSGHTCYAQRFRRGVCV